MRHFLLIPNLKIHNANAVSSPYTIGFPALTAWLGAVHVLQRHLNQSNFKNVKLLNVAVSCHHLNLQTYRSGFTHSIIGTANPLDKDGKRPAFIEEGRCHLEISLLIEYQGLNPNDSEIFRKMIEDHLPLMKFAGGDLIINKPIITKDIHIDEDDENDLRKIKRALMPGYVLIERRDLMVKSMKEENKDALEALLDHLKIMYRCDEKDGEVEWLAPHKKEPGWLVPIAVGFQGISELGSVKNQRDPTIPHRFAESVVTLGEFVISSRIKNLDDMLWQYHVDLENNLYLCQTLSTSTI